LVGYFLAVSQSVSQSVGVTSYPKQPPTYSHQMLFKPGVFSPRLCFTEWFYPGIFLGCKRTHLWLRQGSNLLMQLKVKF